MTGILSSVLDRLRLPVLQTTLDGKPCARNTAFHEKLLPVTAHPLSRLSRADRELLKQLPDGDCLILSFLPSEGGTSILVLRQSDSFFWFFSRVLSRPLPLGQESLSERARRLLGKTLLSLLSGTASDLPSVCALVAEHLFLKEDRLSVEAFAAIIDLIGKLLFCEDCLTKTETAAYLADPITAFAAFGQAIAYLGSHPIYEEEAPPLILTAAEETLFLDYDGRLRRLSPLVSPVGAEAVRPYIFAPQEAEVALLFSLPCDLLLPPQ